MKYSIYLYLILLSGLLSSCTVSTLVVGQPGEKTPIEGVRIYYIDRPACNFETLALITVEGGYHTLTSMLRNMRLQAAAVGADGLYVLQTHRLVMKEYLGTAKAIRCLPA